MQTGTVDKQNIRKACSLWKGFLVTQKSNPEMAVIFCKGALLSLRDEKGVA
jgi:hypothetical protein